MSRTAHPATCAAAGTAASASAWTVYRADGDAEAVQAELFHAGAQAAEWLRPLLNRPHGLLRCENTYPVPGTVT
ncbi:hypothetical protein [Streptomyces antibioticus]|uniref:hypothetical protein n=1 Tax=Streptomyces antibioticus TaxID=1890 RepID=UPI0036D75BD2